MWIEGMREEMGWRDGRFFLQLGRTKTIEEEKEECSKVTWMAYMKEQLKIMGREDKEFAKHSLRAGGATDLFNSNIPLANIMKIGR